MHILLTNRFPKIISRYRIEENERMDRERREQAKQQQKQQMQQQRLSQMQGDNDAPQQPLFGVPKKVSHRISFNEIPRGASRDCSTARLLRTRQRVKLRL